MQNNTTCRCNANCQKKNTPRSQKEIKNLENRINRICGQLGGVKKMIGENAYCNDILIQLCAISSAVKSLSSEILSAHLHTCVKEKLVLGDESALNEIVALFKKFN